MIRPLITRTQTLTHTIGLLGSWGGGGLVLIGCKWDFSWLCATENDRLLVGSKEPSGPTGAK